MKKAVVYLLVLILSVSLVSASLTGFFAGLFSDDPDSAGSPRITNYYADPLKVILGQDLRIVVSFEDDYGVESAIVTFPFENGEDVVEMELIDGTARKGTYSATWTCHDTKNKKWYYSEVTLINSMGKEASVKVAWEDPTVSHSATQITAGTFGAGNYVFQNNLTVNNSDLHVDSNNGRVGIGTTNPASKLTVRSSTSGDQIRLTDSTGLYYKIGRDSATGFLDFQGSQAGFTGYEFVSDDNSVLMSITDNGNVGIGTTSPNGSLDVAGDIHMTGTRTKLFYRGDSGSHEGSLGLYSPNSGTTLIMTPYNNTGGNIASSTITLGGFGNFESNAVSLAVSGSVGIGDNTPDYKLDVESTTGIALSATTTTDYGVYGYSSDSTNGRGIYGYNNQNSATAYGVYGEATGQGRAVYATGGYGLRIAAGSTFLRSSVGTMFACTSTAGTGIGNDCNEVCGYHGLSCYWGLDVAGSGDRSTWYSGSSPCGATCNNGGGSGGIIACICY